MLHACLYAICFVFYYTLWRFYIFSGTNLLTRRHSVSSLFSAIFVFQKSYTGNIFGIGRNKSRTSYFSRTRVGVQSRDGGGSRPGHTLGRRGQALAFALFILRTLLNAVICCSQLSTQRVLGRHLESGLLVIEEVGLRYIFFVVMPSVNLIVILMTYVC
jgi:hypothetical protein